MAKTGIYVNHPWLLVRQINNIRAGSKFGYRRKVSWLEIGVSVTTYPLGRLSNLLGWFWLAMAPFQPANVRPRAAALVVKPVKTTAS